MLLLQLMNAGNLAPRHVQWVADQLSEWCAPLRLNLEAPTVTSFYVDLGDRAGLRRRSPQPLEGRVLFLDTRPLHAVLMQNVIMLEQKVRQDPLSERTPSRAEQLNLADQARGTGGSRIPARRAARRAPDDVRQRRCHRRVREDLGISARRGGRPAGREPRASVGSYGETMEIATFGRMRNETCACHGGRPATTRHLCNARGSPGTCATYRRRATASSRR